MGTIRLGPYESHKEAEEKGIEEIERITIEWTRATLKRLTREPELLRRVVTSLACDLDRTQFAKLTGLETPREEFRIHDGQRDWITPCHVSPDFVLDAILALDLDKE